MRVPRSPMAPQPRGSARSCPLRSAFFFFQAEDGIREHCVTGVQTCALPILAGLEHRGVDRVAQRGADHPADAAEPGERSEEHTSELQSHSDLVCRLLLEKKKKQNLQTIIYKKKKKNKK